MEFAADADLDPDTARGRLVAVGESGILDALERGGSILFTLGVSISGDDGSDKSTVEHLSVISVMASSDGSLEMRSRSRCATAIPAGAPPM